MVVFMAIVGYERKLSFALALEGFFLFFRKVALYLSWPLLFLCRKFLRHSPFSDDSPACVRSIIKNEMLKAFSA